MSPLLPPDYRPSEDEPFMSDLQLEYFRQKLLRWRAELLQESTETLNHLQAESLHQPDLTDRARWRPTARSSSAPATASAS